MSKIQEITARIQAEQNRENRIREAQDILIESRSRTTRQNLVEAKRLMDAHGMRRVILVSDPLHMARALRLSRELGIDALASSTPSTRFRSFHTSWRFLAQEIYFFHRDLFAGGA